MENRTHSDMLQLAETCSSKLKSTDAREQREALELLNRHHRDLQAALDTVLAQQGEFYHLFVVLSFHHQLNTSSRETCLWLEQVLESLDRYPEKDDVFLSRYTYIVGNLGDQYMQAGDYEQAHHRLNQALDLLNRTGKRKQVPVLHNQLGRLAVLQGNSQLGIHYFVKALDGFTQFESDEGCRMTLQHLIKEFAALGETETRRIIEGLDSDGETKEKLLTFSGLNPENK